MKQRLWLSVILMCLSFTGWTQGFVENALLFSRTKPGGSARVQGLGGAQIALGGDYSSALSNPAGLGFYNRSEITFSPAVNTYKVNSTHLGSKENTSSSKLTIPGLSLIYHYPKEQGKFLGGSFYPGPKSFDLHKTMMLSVFKLNILNEIDIYHK